MFPSKEDSTYIMGLLLKRCNELMNVKHLEQLLASSKHHLIVNFYHYFSFFFLLDLSINPSFVFDPISQ